jgi:transposase
VSPLFSIQSEENTMNDIHPMALFRYSVLGPLVSRAELQRGELKATLHELAARHYDIPGSRNSLLSEKTIEAWYYAWRRDGIDALTPKVRSDRGQSKIGPAVQEAILAAKRKNPRRSIRTIRRLLERQGIVAKDELSRSAIHRLLQAHGLSRPSGSASEPEERRAYVAQYAGDIWYGDVMHGPRVPMNGGLHKAYLVSLMDDASRLITHSAFCPGETALDIEAVLKQAVLKRGLPVKLVDRQRFGLPSQDAARDLRPFGHSPDLLPSLCPGRKGKAGEVAPHFSRSVFERARYLPPPRSERSQCPPVGLDRDRLPLHSS